MRLIKKEIILMNAILSDFAALREINKKGNYFSEPKKHRFLRCSV